MSMYHNTLAAAGSPNPTVEPPDPATGQEQGRLSIERFGSIAARRGAEVIPRATTIIPL